MKMEIESYEIKAREILKERYKNGQGYLVSEITETITQLILLDLMRKLTDLDLIQYIQFDKDGKIKVTTE